MDNPRIPIHIIIIFIMHCPDGATGAIADWVKFRYNATIAATYLLRDTGFHGYALPVSQIIPSGEETLDSLLAIIREAIFINVL